MHLGPGVSCVFQSFTSLDLGVLWRPSVHCHSEASIRDNTRVQPSIELGSNE